MVFVSQMVSEQLQEFAGQYLSSIKIRNKNQGRKDADGNVCLKWIRCKLARK